MNRNHFGTDGVRGRTNSHSMTPANITKLAQATGGLFKRGSHRNRVVIAKDTRLSGYMIEPSLVAGFTSVGMDVFLVGPLPTPAVAMLTKTMRADMGVMISASHNPYEDNGIKIFGHDGFKLSDENEAKIESLMETSEKFLASPKDLGRAKRLDDAFGRYVEFAKYTFPKRKNMEGLRIVIDCANGAGYKVGPTILQELGAHVITIGAEPDGFNINQECGSTSTNALKAKVVETRADIGIALDGDADRLIVCDEKGNAIDGDQILAMIAGNWKSREKLSSNGIVATVMSNMGLEQYLNSIDLTLQRTKVGDRYVVQRRRQDGINVGGEQSGHIIFSDHATTGDGIVAALQVIAVMVEAEKPFSEISKVFEPVPQILENVKFKGENPLADEGKNAALEKLQEEVKDMRLLVRKSGTENLIRIMGEGENEAQVKELIAKAREIIA